MSKVAYRVLNLCGLATFDLIVQVEHWCFWWPDDVIDDAMISKSIVTRWCPWWHDDVLMGVRLCSWCTCFAFIHMKKFGLHIFFFFQVTKYFYLDVCPRMTCLFFLKSTLCQWSDQIVLWTDRWQNINFCLAAEIFVFIRKTFLKLQLILYSGANIFPIHPLNISQISGQINAVHPVVEKHCQVLHYCGKNSNDR